MWRVWWADLTYSNWYSENRKYIKGKRLIFEDKTEFFRIHRRHKTLDSGTLTNLKQNQQKSTTRYIEAWPCNSKGENEILKEPQRKDNLDEQSPLDVESFHSINKRLKTLEEKL